MISERYSGVAETHLLHYGRSAWRLINRARAFVHASWRLISDPHAPARLYEELRRFEDTQLEEASLPWDYVAAIEAVEDSSGLVLCECTLRV